MLDRHGDAILFNPRLVAFAKHYHFEIRPEAVARGNEKGRVERAIGYARTSFWPARRWRDLDDLNAQAEAWCLGAASERPWPGDRQKMVATAFADEQPRRAPVPEAPLFPKKTHTLRKGYSWAKLLRRVWLIDVLLCQCGGRRRITKVPPGAVQWEPTVDSRPNGALT